MADYVATPHARRRETLGRRAAVVRRYCAAAGAQVASETVQLHGGIAITWEHDAHLVLKRLHSLAALSHATG